MNVGNSGGVVPLKLWLNREQKDHMLCSSDESEKYALQSGYILLRTVGAVFTHEGKGRVPLILMRHTTHCDHALVTDKGTYELMGYVAIRIEGYVPCATLSSMNQGHTPLTTYYSVTDKDTMGVADAQAADFVRKNGYVLRKMECRILSETSMRSLSAVGLPRVASKRLYPKGEDLATNEFYDFAAMPTKDLEALTDAVVNIQKIFRGHRARLSFQTLRPSAFSAMVDRALDHERTSKRMHQFESILSGLDEALLAMGADHEAIGSLKTAAGSVRAKYQHAIDDVQRQREAARERLEKVKQIVSEANEAPPPNFLRVCS